MDGQMLMSVNEGGMQYLLAGARANVGVKGGRYMFEVKILEALSIAESAQQGGKKSRQVLRVGFSAASTSLLLGDDEECAFFDNEGMFTAARSRTRAGAKMQRDQVLCVLLNLDAKSPNVNTVSLFQDGVRRGKPQKLPEALVGKTLFPHITYRNMSVQVNMGPTPLRALPFTCNMIQGAAKEDAAVSEEKPPKGGKHEVLMPVGFPDEGTFDWLDSFLEKNPSYVELSDRKLQEWATSSGLPKPRQGGSKDKPNFSYGMPSMDDRSLQRVVNTLAPLTPRNYIIMEVKSNLIASERANVLKRFSSDKFKKVARVIMGEPKDAYKKKVQQRILKDKQTKLDISWKAKKEQQEHKKLMIQRQKEMAEKKKELEAKKKEEEAKKKEEEEAKKKEEEAKKKEEGAEEDKKEEETKEEETKKEDEEETKAEDKAQEKAKEEPKEEEMEDLGDEPPTAELSEEEQKLFFLPKGPITDLAPSVLNKSFANFTIPEAEEGFDAVNFEWQPEAKAKEYLAKWVLETKATALIEDLVPSKYFQEKYGAFTKQNLEWQGKQKAFKANPPKEAAAVEAPTDDIFKVEDVNDIGGGKPLYADFGPEDWALLQLRSELYLLQDAFKKDVNDPDREAIPENHIAYYYNKYFKKALNPKMFNLPDVFEMIKLVKDTVAISEDKKVLTSKIEEEVEGFDVFMKLAEENRKYRSRRVEAGDETNRLQFNAEEANRPAPKPAGNKGGGKGKGKGGKKGKW
eukprot:TRINITY_DN50_c0_g1_i3.p1 TRINITY_DN50_c0_g1~~TRINITY_DN50_c0_g1_i3.p1  ORF type:complete len:821 (-),score=308.17 TRINITY_DN50_c0_g1_i3:116-2341(-)